MRTTLNLDEDLSLRPGEEAWRQGSSLSRMVNETLRAGLRRVATREDLCPHVAPILDTGRPLLDVTDVAEALDMLERG